MYGTSKNQYILKYIAIHIDDCIHRECHVIIHRIITLPPFLHVASLQSYTKKEQDWKTNKSSVFQTKVSLLLLALKWLEMVQFKNGTIKIDNQAAVKAICSSYHISQLGIETQELLWKIRKCNICIQLTLEIIGNEETDRAAKEGTK